VAPIVVTLCRACKSTRTLRGPWPIRKLSARRNGGFLSYISANYLVGALGGLIKGSSIPYTIWLAIQSLFFSYFVGFASLIVLMRYGRRFIVLPKITPIGLLRYCTLFAFISVIMSGALVYRAPYLAPWHWRNWFGLIRDQNGFRTFPSPPHHELLPHGRVMSGLPN
jgi:hypothetical protein